MRRLTTTAAALSACAAFLAGCADTSASIAAAATVPSTERTDEVRCREAEPRHVSLTDALETLELANLTTFDSAHLVATSALSSWVGSFKDAADGPLADAYVAGERKLAHLERMDATTPHPELVEWVRATSEVVADAAATCTELTTTW